MGYIFIYPLSNIKIIGAEILKKETSQATQDFNIFLEVVANYLNKSFKEIRESVKKIDKRERGKHEKAQN